MPGSIPDRGDVVVVGGGIIGCSAAYELARGGASIVLLERSELAAGASGRNHGLLLSPLDPVLVPMAQASTEVYERLSPGLPIPIRLDDAPIGFLVVASEDTAQREAARAEAEAAGACGVAVRRPERAELFELEPGLAEDVAEGWLLEDGRRLDPAALTVGLALLAREKGAHVRTGTPVRALLMDGDRVTGVVTDIGTVRCQTVVLAAGPWSPPLLRQAGIHLALTGARGWLVHLAPSKPVIGRLVGRAGWHAPPRPELLPPFRAAEITSHGAGAIPPAEVGTLLQPNGDGTVLVGGSRQAVLTSEPEDPRVPHRLVEGAVALVPAIGEAAVLGAWWGIRPATPDGRPFVGRVRAGLIVATGHGSLGIILGAGTARLVSSMILGHEEPFDPAPFAPRRFDGGTG